MNYCGIDLASQASAVCVLNQQGTIVQEQMVATEEGALRAALVGLSRLWCVVEAAPLAEWVVQVLEDQGLMKLYGLHRCLEGRQDLNGGF